MSYQLFAASNRGAALASKECDDDFAGETWAREWVLARGTEADYLIERPETGYSASLFRTAAGQWYIMRNDSSSTGQRSESAPAALQSG